MATTTILQTIREVRDMNLIDMERIRRTGQSLRQLFSELGEIFPERENLLNQILYAVLTRHHVLVFGPWGTGKTDLMNTLFGSFSDAAKCAIQFSKFMNESGVFGTPDVRTMYKEGYLKFPNGPGTIFECEFLDLDEFLDASEPLQRALLGPLNERVFKRGRQFENMKLHTAVAATNCDPVEEIKKNPKLGAVIDRFLFQSRVTYLKTPESRRRMYQKYLCGEKPSVIIPYDDLKYLSEIVLGANQITDPYFIEVYDEVMEKFCAARGKDNPVSDRRKCKLLQIVEANALLYGRYEVHFEDILPVKWGLCMGDDEKELKRFDEVATPIIEEANRKKAQSLDEVQLSLIAQLEATLPRVPKNASDEELLKLARNLTGFKKQAEEIKPQLATTQGRLKELLAKIEKKRTVVSKRINNEPDASSDGE